MYFNNALGGGRAGPMSLASPPDYNLAALLRQQQARPSMTGPQIPPAGQRAGMMSARPPADLSRSPNIPTPGSTAPGSGDIGKLLASPDPEKAKGLLQSLGLDGSGGPLFDIGAALGLPPLSQILGLPGYAGGGPTEGSPFSYGIGDFGGGSG